MTATRGAVAAGAVCVVILAGMIVGHAWPLWTGQAVLLRVVPVDPRDMFRGEYVRLSTPASTLHVDREGRAQRDGAVTVRPVGDWWPEGNQDGGSISRALRGRVVYVQLEREPGGVEYRPVTISRGTVRGALNLRGRVQPHSDTSTLRVDYGIDRFFMQEGTAKPVEEAVLGGRVVQMDVAIARNGRARIRNLVIDGMPLQRR